MCGCVCVCVYVSVCVLCVCVRACVCVCVCVGGGGGGCARACVRAANIEPTITSSVFTLQSVQKCVGGHCTLVAATRCNWSSQTSLLQKGETKRTHTDKIKINTHSRIGKTQ